MIYAHETDWRKPSVHPLCVSYPPADTNSEAMRAYLDKRDLSFDLAVMNGWYESSCAGDDYPRVVIPAVTHVPGHAYWQARDTTGKAYLRYQTPKGPRYEALIQVLPLLDLKGTVIVEGPMDALAAAGAGYAGIALMGMTPGYSTIVQLTKLLDRHKPVFVLLDRDSNDNAHKLAIKLAGLGVNSKVIFLPGPEKDLAQCTKLKRRKFLVNELLNSSNRRS